MAKAECSRLDVVSISRTRIRNEELHLSMSVEKNCLGSRTIVLGGTGSSSMTVL
jgi:hypothetical protein